MFDISELWAPKFQIQPDDKVVAFGSCFAQNIGKALRARGCNWYITEPAPQGLSPENMHKFGYDLFSCRTGNIYTTSMLRQWVSWAVGQATPPDEIWQHDEGVFDPFRPTIEPGGFATPEELIASREVAINAFRACIVDAQYFVFTLGLTEHWRNSVGGYEYTICPGTAAGQFDETQHQFGNLSFDQVRDSLSAVFDMMRTLNPDLKIILTVSPVPLIATNAGEHVIVASSYSKSVLRAVAGYFAQERAEVDYFPSYEIINSPVFRGTFFAPNQSQVDPRGVEFVMDHFFAAQPAAAQAIPPVLKPTSKNDTLCDEELLDAFGARP